MVRFPRLWAAISILQGRDCRPCHGETMFRHRLGLAARGEGGYTGPRDGQWTGCSV